MPDAARAEESEDVHIFIDGQNFKRTVAAHFGRSRMTADLPRLAEAIVRTQRNARLAGIRYYTGIATKERPAERAEMIAFLDRLHDQGIATFANDIELNAVGQFKEVGIDLKLTADMVSVMLNNPRAKSFIVVSGDRDFDPAYTLMTDLAKRLGREIRVTNAVVGPDRGSPNARRYEITREMYDRFATVTEDFRQEGQRRLEVDRDLALDGRAHDGRPQGRPIRRSEPPARGTGYYVNLNSLGAAAKREFGRTHLDLNVTKMLLQVGTQIESPPKYARAYASMHTPEHNLVNHLLVRDLLVELQRRRVDTKALNYFYRNAVIGQDTSGPGRSTPIRAPIAEEKRVGTQMLADVVKDVLSGKADRIVLASDDRNMWPIADLARELGRLTKQIIDVHSIHFGEHAIDRTEPVRIDRARYESLLDGRDRLEEARTQAETIMESEREQLEEMALRRFGTKREVVSNPKDAEGVVFARTAHWYAFDDGLGTVALVPNLPMEPVSNVKYVLHDGTLRQADVRTVDRVPTIRQISDPGRSHGDRSA